MAVAQHGHNLNYILYKSKFVKIYVIFAAAETGHYSMKYIKGCNRTSATSRVTIGRVVFDPFRAKLRYLYYVIIFS